MIDYSVGEQVEVHAFGHWYEGEVVKVGYKCAHVRYTTGTGAIHVKAAKGDLIRKIEQEPITLLALPDEERQEDRRMACGFAGCAVRFPK